MTRGLCIWMGTLCIHVIVPPQAARPRARVCCLCLAKTNTLCEIENQFSCRVSHVVINILAPNCGNMCPAKTRQCSCAGLIPGQRRRRWPSIKTTQDQYGNLTISSNLPPPPNKYGSYERTSKTGSGVKRKG